MHLVDGIISTPVLVAGALASAGGIAIGLRRMEEEQVPQTAILAAVFFVGSLIHLRTGLTSTHLVLNGLLGILLGWAAFPAIAIGLFLQCLFFAHGGFTTLGVNTFNMAAPAVLCWYLFGRGNECGTNAVRRGFASGFLAVLLAALLVALSLLGTDPAFALIAQVTILHQLPVMVIEGAITASALSFLARVRPRLLRVAIASESS